MRNFVLLRASALCLFQLALSAQQPPAPSQNPSHHDAVSSRGDHAMGFSHETTTHHFRLDKTGGAIDVSAKNPKDSSTRDEIRMHVSHIAKRFAAGDFDVPVFIHDTTPPGAPVMAKLRGQIRYLYTDTPSGAKIQISTANPEALQAIHAFLRFHISDHQTGDSTEVQASPL
jgi:hypothetical protein